MPVVIVVGNIWVKISETEGDQVDSLSLHSCTCLVFIDYARSVIRLGQASLACLICLRQASLLTREMVSEGIPDDLELTLDHHEVIVDLSL